MYPKNTITLIVAKLTVIFCIFSTKIVLVGVGEGGVRVDDLLIPIAFLLLLLGGEFPRFTFPGYVKVYLVFVGFSFVSAVYNAVVGRVDFLISALFVLRLVEYLVFFPMGVYLARSGVDLGKALKTYCIFLIVLVPLQFSGIVSVNSSFESSRAIGNTNGPYELAAVCCFLFFYFQQNSAKTLQIASLIICIATAARITVASLGVTWIVGLFAFRHRVGSPRTTFVAVLVLTVAALAVVLTLEKREPIQGVGDEQTSNLLSRVADLYPKEMLDSVDWIYENAGTFATAREFLETGFYDSFVFASNLSGDYSGYIRIAKWSILLKSTWENLDSTFFGMGPSIGTVAVDGYGVRLLCETGLVGAGIFLVFCWSIVRSAPLDVPEWIKAYFWTMIGTSIFIDIFVSYKPMILLWLALGMHHGWSRSFSDATRPA